VISGYYGFDNLGDEAVLAAILHQLGNLAPGSRCIVISGNPASTAEEHGAEAVSRFDIKGLWTALRQGMVFISGGGTLFQDVTSTRSLYYYLLMVILARAFRLPVVIYGQGIGPFVSKLNSLLTRRVLKLCRLIIVREREAYRQLVEWGFDEEQLYLAADPAVALWNPSPDQAPSVGGSRFLLRRTFGSEFPQEGPVLLVSLRPWPLVSGCLSAVAEALDQLSREGWQVVFVPFQFDADRVVCLQCADLMRERAFLWPRPLRVQEALKLFGEADYCLGMRLHALIFAAVHRRPMLGLAYDPKVENFLLELDLQDAVFYLPRDKSRSIDSQELLARLHWLKAEREALTAKIHQKVGEMAVRVAEANRRLREELAAAGVRL